MEKDVYQKLKSLGIILMKKEKMHWSTGFYWTCFDKLLAALIYVTMMYGNENFIMVYDSL